MKRSLITTLIMVLALVDAFAVRAEAQQPTAPQTNSAHAPAVAQPTAEQKAQIAALAKAWEQKAREADAARDKYMIQLLATLAELGLKPSETSITWNEKGEPIFIHVEPSKPPTTQTAKPEAKP